MRLMAMKRKLKTEFPAMVVYKKIRGRKKFFDLFRY
jgi:hypothetical protein